MNAPAISVMLVDDHDLVREGLWSILAKERDFDVVAEARTGEEAIELLVDRDVDVIVLDLRLRDMSGVELCREIAERRLRAQVVVLSGSIDERNVGAALWAGARGYVVKDVDPDELKRAIRRVALGHTSLDPMVTRRFMEWAARLDRTRLRALPPRQLRVLQGLAQGKSAREISNAQGLTYQTVKTYMRDIYRRLGVSNRTEAVAVAVRDRIV
ncbi:MAG TPA: response regulator transcription factor [Actinomycetota bacterium]